MIKFRNVNINMIIPILLAVVVLITGTSVILTGIIKKDGESANNSSIGYVSSDINNKETLDLSTLVKDVPPSIKAATLTPGVDFLKDGEDFDSASKELQTLIASVTADKLNAINIKVNYNDGLIFENEHYENICGDLLNYIYGIAKEHDLSVITTIDIGKLAKKSVVDKEDIKKISDVLSSANLLNHSDMLVLDGYLLIFAEDLVTNQDEATPEDLRAMLSSAMKEYYIAVMNSDKTKYMGVMAEGLYTGPVGEDTFYIYDDGFADISTWLKESYTDFVFISNINTTDNPTINFSQHLEKWKEIVGENGDIFCEIYYSMLGTSGDWKKTDEILKQLMVLDELNISGFSFDSYLSYKNDKTESRDAVLKYLEGKLTPSYILTDLSVTSPSKTTFTTNSPSVSLVGASDPQFKLTLNGEELSRNELGYFSLDLDLKLGTNTFKLIHKGETKTYKITYKKVVIKSVDPTKVLKLEGGSTIIVSVVALAKSTVTSSLNGTNITLYEEPILDELGEETEYSTYIGRFIMPTVYDSNKYLGTISFKAVSSYGTENKSGSKVTVLKSERPVESKPESSEESSTSSSESSSSESNSSGSSSNSTSSGSTTSELLPPGVTPEGPAWSKPSSNGNYVDVGNSLIAEVVIPMAETFNAGDSADYSRPTNNYLPAGTVDYCTTTTITSGSAVMRTLRYGKMMYTTYKDVQNIKTYKGTLPDHNEIAIAALDNGGRYTNITLNTLWKAPFLLDLKEQKYTISSEFGSNRDYTITEATYTYIDITFAYATAVQGEINLDGNTLFKSAEWIKNSSDYTLRLYLKRKGQFYGWTAWYNEANQLVFSFLNPGKVTIDSSNSYGYSMKGITIVVDAGHGGSDPGAISGSNKNFTESYLNLMLANMVKKELESMGATVVMTRTGDTTLTNNQRISIARNAKPDLILSIHRNSNDSTSPHGFQSFNFNAFSSNAVKKVFNATMTENLYGESKWNSVKWHAFFMSRIADCPVILTENGFMSNSSDFSKMITPEFNKKCAKALTQGILDYFVSIQ